MSNIDQAFINAYSDHSSAVSPQVPIATKTESPELRIFAHAVERGPRETRADRAEPVIGRPPHFSGERESVLSAVAAAQAHLAETDEIILPSLVSERKPLSAFAIPRQAPSAAFKPVFEVDRFRWPAVTDDLVHASKDLLIPIVDAVCAGARDGRSLVGIAGTTNGVGASTVTMCLARLTAGQGSTVALVDANFVEGNLATALGLEFDAGWEDVLAGEMPLAECAVQSLADRMTLIPLGGKSETACERLASIQSSVIAGMLRYHHELVLFDLGSASDPRQFQIMRSIVEHCRLDVGIIVAPSGARDVGTLHAVEQLTTLFGPHCLGVIGNRAS